MGNRKIKSNSCLRFGLFIAVLQLCLFTSSYAEVAGNSHSHGPLNAITDVPGIKVGQVTKDEPPYLTGVTVVYAVNGATGSAYVPGGWPGTINTVVLQPGHNTQESNAVFLTGGSYYGLGVFGGVMGWLEQHVVGLQVGPKPSHVDPLVSGAVVFDLGRGGDFSARPTAKFGFKAMQLAQSGQVDQGNVGAGTGTLTGGDLLPLKGGVGTASVELDNGVVVGAIAAVNAVGTPVDLSDCSLRAANLEIGNEFGSYTTPSAQECAAVLKKAGINGVSVEANMHPNTTIGVVATNAKLNREQAHMMAKAAARGQSRAIEPVHLLGDGDSFFALATGEVMVNGGQTDEIYRAANRAFARAIVHAMLNANSIRGFTSYCDKFTTASCQVGND